MISNTLSDVAETDEENCKFKKVYQMVKRGNSEEKKNFNRLVT